jgi:hypothetical protein
MEDYNHTIIVEEIGRESELFYLIEKRIHKSKYLTYYAYVAMSSGSIMQLFWPVTT